MASACGLVRRPVQLALVERGGLSPSLARLPSGDWRMCYTRPLESSSLAGRSVAAPHTEFPVLNSAGFDNSPKVSPDGKSIAFRSTRSGSWELWLHSSGQEPVQLTNFGGAVVGGCDWSPDNRQIAFDVLLSKGRFAVAVIDLALQHTTMLSQGSSNDQIPKRSADGKWIYFRSDRGGTDQIWKTPAGGGAVQITRAGGEGPLGESRDGRFIFYYLLANDGVGTVRRIRPDGSDDTEIVRGPMAHGDAVVRDKGVYFQQADKSNNLRLFFFPFDRSGPQLLHSESRSPGYGIDVSYDERRILYTTKAFCTSLMLAEHIR